MIQKPILLQLFLIAFAVCALLCGCKKPQPPDQGAAPAPPAVSEEMRSGELTVQLSLSSRQISVAENLQLTLTALAPEEFSITFPEFTGSIGDFTVTGTAPSPKELAGTQIRQSRTWILSPSLPGRYVIPPMKVSALNSDDTSRQEELTVPARTITVTSFLQADENDPQIADIFAPVARPAPTIFFLLLAGGALLAVSGLAYYLYRRSRLHTAHTPPALPHAAALAEIERLVRDEQAGADRALFYSRLSLILRRYLEARFGLRAAEQTSEEFLDAMRNSPLFTGEQQGLLSSFLRRSDLIKFARIIPDRQEVDASIELCRNFIVITGATNEKSRAGGGPEGTR